jgi:hypothetical protein
MSSERDHMLSELEQRLAQVGSKLSAKTRLRLSQNFVEVGASRGFVVLAKLRQDETQRREAQFLWSLEA